VTNGEVSLFFGKLAAVGGTFLSAPGYDNEENLDNTRLERAEPWTDANNKAVMNFANGLGKNDRCARSEASFCRPPPVSEAKHPSVAEAAGPRGLSGVDPPNPPAPALRPR
jgi:hypothetical protein